MMNFLEQMNTFNYLERYRSPGNTSFYKGVPVSYRDLVLKYYKTRGFKVKLRYRGPRTHGTQSYCTLGDATTFAVYVRTW
jgi:hypothetical protein